MARRTYFRRKRKCRIYLEDHPHARALLLTTGRLLAKVDYQAFLAAGIQFEDPDTNMPLKDYAQMRAGQLHRQAFQHRTNMREDLRIKNHEVAIELYKVSYFCKYFISSFELLHFVSFRTKLLSLQDLKSKHKVVPALTMQQALRTTFYFVKRIMVHVDEGREAELLKKREILPEVRVHVKDQLLQFLDQEHISRCCPGKKVSVGYGRQATLHRLLASKQAIIEQFSATLDEHYSPRTLLRYWPRNYRTPRSSDRERNCCPTHDGFGRLLTSLQSAGVANNVPNSCRAASYMSLCNDSADPLDPLTWKAKCALGECTSCPGLIVDGDVCDNQFTFLDWRKDVVAKLGKDGKKREMFTLHPTTIPISQY